MKFRSINLAWKSTPNRLEYYGGQYVTDIIPIHSCELLHIRNSDDCSKVHQICYHLSWQLFIQETLFLIVEQS
jgi:hypothetical protein